MSSDKYIRSESVVEGIVSELGDNNDTLAKVLGTTLPGQNTLALYDDGLNNIKSRLQTVFATDLSALKAGSYPIELKGETLNSYDELLTYLETIAEINRAIPDE